MSAIAVFAHEISGFVKFWNAEEARVHFMDQTIPSDYITVEIELYGLSEGAHGIHIHEYGDLSESSTDLLIKNTKELKDSDKKSCCQNVCNHYNPTNAKHGSSLLHGHDCHAGDLCNNIIATAKGAFLIFQYSGESKRFEIGDILGRSIVLHENTDDLGRYRDQDPNGSGKTGNAGNKIACAVIGRMKPLKGC